MNLLNRTMQAARGYTVVDYGALKLMLLTAGILIGSSEPEVFRKHKAPLAGLFAATYGWIVYRTFFNHQR